MSPERGIQTPLRSRRPWNARPLIIYCDGEPVRIVGDRHASAWNRPTCSRCGKRVRIAW